jgi:hypothetical protein
MFLITFFVIMLAFSCGVSYMFNYLTDGTGSSTGGVFTYFFWVLLQVGSMVLHVQLPHGRNRLQHRRCLHLLLLGPSPGRFHGPTCLLSQEGTGSSTSNVFTYFWVLLQVGSLPHGGDRLQHWRCLHLLLLGPSPSRLFWSYMFNYLTDRTGSSTGSVFAYFFWVLLQVGSMVLPCCPTHRGDRLQHW